MVMVSPEAPSGKHYKMRVRQDEFLIEFEGHIPAGAVIVVDEDTAIRWMEKRIADPAPANAPTLSERRRDDFRARLEASGAETQEGVYNAAITRDSFIPEGQSERIGPKPMPRGRRGRAARADLDGAEVANEELVEDWPEREG